MGVRSSRGPSTAIEGRLVFTAAGLVVAVIAAVFWTISIAALRAQRLKKRSAVDRPEDAHAR